ncbi:MAG: biopolymer transporter ExbD [Planctomycetes bacterium]|nr:biopolymer transporter ExbD [Planctomycetota bacterium]
MRIERRAPSRGVDVVPLIDTVFLLLVIFLVMVLRMRVDEGLHVELPPVGGEAGAAAADDAGKLVIGVDPAGEVVVRGRSVARSALAAELAHVLSSARPQETVEIRGDREAPHGAVMAVLAAVQGAGIRDIRFQVAPVGPMAGSGSP